MNGNSGSSLASDTYYYIPSCGSSDPGQCSTLTLPATLTGRIVTSTSRGLPFVAYQYDLGAGWVTYDNVSFSRMANASDSGFRVDGFAPTPYAASLYYDASGCGSGPGRLREHRPGVRHQPDPFVVEWPQLPGGPDRLEIRQQHW